MEQIMGKTAENNYLNEGEKAKPAKKLNYFKTFKSHSKYKIFLSKKLKRNGLLEKKTILMNSKIKVGRWTKEEHKLFLIACNMYGPQWKKVRILINFLDTTGCQNKNHGAD
jgi:hypothetical protein